MVMRRLTLTVFLLAQATFAAAQATATVTRNGNLRPTPSSAQASIRLLTPPEVLTLVSTVQVNGYYHVHTAQNEDGWIYHTSVKVGGTVPAQPAVAPVCGPGTEIALHAACPAVGTHGKNQQLVPYAADSDAGLRNLAKRHVPDPACSPRAYTLDDARSLQNYVSNTYGDAHATKTAFAPTRSLKNIPTFDGTLSEGDSVRLSAYLLIARDEAQSPSTAAVTTARISTSASSRRRYIRRNMTVWSPR